MIDAISTLTSQFRGIRGTSEVASTTAASAVGMPQPVGATSFSDVLADVTKNAVSALKAGEAAAITGVQGKTSVQNVVEAIMSAEQSLQTAVAVRDKVVSAYQEISRMAI